MKKKLAVILASAMAVSLTACGGSKAPETTAAAKTEAPAADSKAEDKAEDTQAAGGDTQAASEASGNVMLYSSMQEDQLMAIKEGFEKKAEKYSELAKQIKGIVQENYHDSSLNSQRIADMIQMNNAYLGRMFKNSYGRSINDYINTCRLEESMRLLRQTDMSVEEIAQNVGFSNIKYFYVLFKKLTGITPATYRAG